LEYIGLKGKEHLEAPKNIDIIKVELLRKISAVPAEAPRNKPQPVASG